MWVFCCGMFRSASTLQFQITTRIVKDYGLGKQIGWIDAKRFAEVREKYCHDQGLQVIKVHVCTDEIAETFQRHEAIGIYTFRDIRDVYASYMSQRTKPFDFLWQEGFLETCLKSYEQWTNLPNVLISCYEDIVQDLPEEVRRIAHHLGVSLSPETCEQIASDYSIEHQQKRIQQFKQQLLQSERNPHDHREIVDYHDEESLLHLNHIHSAKNGRWQNDLSPLEAERIVHYVQDWCSQNQYSASCFLRDEKENSSAVPLYLSREMKKPSQTCDSDNSEQFDRLIT